MTTFTEEVRATVNPHKFGDDRMAAACYLIDLDGCADAITGDVEWSDGYVALIGRRLMTIDSAGFVYCSSFADAADAVATFQGIDQAYAEDCDAQEQEATAWAEGFRPSDTVSIDRYMVGDAVTVLGYEGIAFRVEGLPVWRGPDYEWSGIFYQHPNRRLVHMVGDDRTFDVHVDELTPLDEDDFCSGCGQIGCGWC